MPTKLLREIIEEQVERRIYLSRCYTLLKTEWLNPLQGHIRSV